MCCAFTRVNPLFIVYDCPGNCANLSHLAQPLSTWQEEVWFRSEPCKDTHRVPYTEVAIHPDGAGSDPLAYVRWFKDRIVIETEMHVFATHERNQLDSMTQATILVGRSGHFSGVLRGEQLRQFTGELIRIHIHGEPGLAAMLVWSKERHRQPLGHLVDPDLVRKEHNVKATL